MWIKHGIKRLLFIATLIVSPAGADSLRFGVVPQFEASRLLSIWEPLLLQVSQRAGVDIQFVPSPSIPQFEKAFEQGEFDLVYMNPYHLIVANKMQGYLPVLNDNSRQLFGIIVVRKDSPLTSIEQLNGKTVAFPAPNALGAALIPRTEFAEKYKIEVNELYTESHSSSYLSVLVGKADAGGGVMGTFNQQPKKYQDRLRILYETSRVSPHPIAVHPRVDAEVIKAVIQAFLKVSETEQGSQLLQKIPIKQLGETGIDDYRELTEMGLERYYVR
jgi:phosphonate transport system substrate-binding protein